MQNEEQTVQTDGQFLILELLSQTSGYLSTVTIPNMVISDGALGMLLMKLFTYSVVGIPLLYMELIVSQFTARDSLQVWRARTCVAHIGYLSVLWQVIVVLFNHTLISFNVHYLIISFESTIPYYSCGPWAFRNCNIFIKNHTINEDCLTVHLNSRYCASLYTTFPEYQYWQNYLMGESNLHKNGFHIAWRLGLTSAIMSCWTYLACFKGKHSIRWFLGFFVVYPMIGYLVLLLGSMRQKGLVLHYEDALDADFSVFMKKFTVSPMVILVVHSLGTGTGVICNLASRSSFRTPCYSQAMVATVVTMLFSTLIICSTAMLYCPYAYAYGIKTKHIAKYPRMSVMYEKIPRLLYQYEKSSLWLILFFSCNVCLGFGKNILLFYTLIEMLMKRYSKVARYPGLTSFIATILMFLITFPTLGEIGANLIAGSFRRHLNLIGTLIALIECYVFVIWYGIDRFCEDVHFMQGIQPSSYMKLSWVLSAIVVTYAVVHELLFLKKPMYLLDKIGYYLLWFSITFISVGLVLQMIVAKIRDKFWDVVRLEPTWGPKCEVLRRSRTMFSAQAMTKEYIYRQYHLQAGILARQKASNARNNTKSDAYSTKS